MKTTPIEDLRKLTIEQLEALVLEERAALYKTRRDFVFRQTTDTAGVKTRRHQIARIMTIITEKKKELANG